MKGQVLGVNRAALVLLLAGLVAQGCYNIKDEDRCFDGYIYDSEAGECVLNVDAAVTVDAEVTVDASPTGEDGGGGFSGLWEDCLTDADCTGDADYCAYSPQGQVGYCTVTECTAGSCPSGYWCCDCTAASWPVMCADENHTMIAAFCTCPVE